MKQVIIYIKDSENKTTEKCYFYSIGQFNDVAYDFLNNYLIKNTVAIIKFGNLHISIRSYGDIMVEARMNNLSYHDQIKHWLKSYEIQYYLNEYLPKY